MVTKGYQKGVYDRVTEGTWESAQNREAAASSLQGMQNGRNPTLLMWPSLYRAALRAGNRGEHEDQNSQKRWPGKAA